MAIASAVNFYARIHMIHYINTEGVVYKDTFSIFSTTNNLPVTLIGKELVLKKDKLNGSILEEAYLLYINKIVIPLEIW